MLRSAAVDHFVQVVPWSELGPPLRPSPADIRLVQRAIDRVAPRRTLLLGLTPEIAACRWPTSVEFIAIDHSAEMIRLLWPPTTVPADARVMLADWCEMPVETGSVDLVVGDGCLTLLTFDGWKRMAKEVRRVLAPQGKFVLRLFLRPDETEPVEHIARALAEGMVGDINALKLRLFAAAHSDGTRLRDVWEAWNTMRRDPGAGFSEAAIAGVERYRDSDSRYFLGTAAETRKLLGTALDEVAWWTPTGYELAERCPTAVFGAPQGIN